MNPFRVFLVLLSCLLALGMRLGSASAFSLLPVSSNRPAISHTHRIHHRHALTTRLLAEDAEIDSPVTLTEDPTIENESDEDADELVDSVTEQLDDLEGLWYSDDFYGAHGREWVQMNCKLSLNSETGAATSALVAVKVTGDPNVPAGCVTFQTIRSFPSTMGEKVAAEIQVRADPQDPDGFTWIPGELTLVAKNEIRLVGQYSI